MKVLLIFDKFKGSLSAKEATRALTAGLNTSNPSALIAEHPMADGGDGSIEILSQHLNLNKITTSSIDPIGRAITAHYFSKNKTAYIELATCSGLALLSKEEYAPMKSNTIGTGLLIAHAIAQGHQKIILAIGGSSSTEGGTGILHALRYSFKDQNDDPINPSGENLTSIHKILPPLQKISIPITILSDVKNKLYGPLGSAYTYAPQKGATQKQVIQLDQGLRHFAKVTFNMTGIKIDQVEGGGAAGGVAAGLSAFLNTKIEGGFQYISAVTKLEAKVKDADLIITGEGKFDKSSLNGKLVGEVLKMAKQHQKKAIVICGKKDSDLDLTAFAQMLDCYEITAVESNLDTAMKQAKELLKQIAAGIRL